MSNLYRKSFQKLTAFFLLILFGSNFCVGAWTGTVTYTRTQTNSDNKTVERISGRRKTGKRRDGHGQKFYVERADKIHRR